MQAECSDGAIRSCYTGPDGTLNRGLCRSGEQACYSGRWGTCSDTRPVAELCDGFDNDCDGVLDGADPDLVLSPCERDAGLCAGALHASAQCVAGEWGACDSSNYGASFSLAADICDGVDNDCDRSTDEDFDAGVCSTGLLGVCGLGTSACVNARVVCATDAGPSPEVRNGRDDDCDGILDWPVLSGESGASEITFGLTDGVGDLGWQIVVSPAGSAADAGVSRVVLADAGVRFSVSGLLNGHHYTAVAAGLNVDGGRGRFSPAVTITPAEILASGLAANVDSLASDGVWLYASVNNGPQDPIYRIPLDGGPPTTLTTIANPWFIVIDGPTLFVNAFFEIWRVDLVTGLKTRLATAVQRSTGFVVDGTTIYYSENDADTVRAITKDGGLLPLIATGLTRPGFMADDGTHILVAHSQEVLSISKATRIKTVIIDGGWSQGTGLEIVPTSAAVYLRRGTDLVTLPRDGGQPLTVRTGIDVGGTGGTRSLLEDGAHLYLSGVTGTPATDQTGGVWRMNKSDGGMTAHLLTTAPNPGGSAAASIIIIGNDLVHFGTDGIVRRIAK